MSSKKITPEKPAEEALKPSSKKIFQWKVVISWGVTALLVGILLLVLFQGTIFAQSTPTETVETTPTPLNIALPPMQTQTSADVVSVPRSPNLDTTVPEGTRQSIIHYTVEAGDSIFSIANKFDLTPESVLFANYAYFRDDPTVTLSTGADLTIPPTNGVLYTWKEGDNLAKIASQYGADESKIISWPSNHIDITNPVVSPGAIVMVPGGFREVKSWIQVVEYTARSGVTRVVSGPGGCTAPEYGPVGSGIFIWPNGNYGSVSGWGFTSQHRGIDISAGVGEQVWASDAGTVVYAGWNDTGYGNMIMIDHNNGWATLYGHLSAIYVSCGQGVDQRTVIGLSGSTGNSTGPHLHFEVRQGSGFVNPWYVLQ